MTLSATEVQERTKPQSRRAIFYILTASVGIELLLFFWLCLLGQEAFKEFIWAPDTSEYNRVALQLAETFALTSSPRTLGYPLFLSLGYLIGGQNYGIYVIIGAQLVLNIVFTWGCWRLLQRLVPAAGVILQATATLFFFWAGLGMAFYLLSDFLASLFFAIFLYGLLFWRTPSSVVLAGISLALATLTRPTFTFVPLLLPIAAYLVGHITSKVPWHYIVAFMVASFAATGISITYQYITNGYIGSSPILTPNIEVTLYSALAEGQRSRIDHMQEFKYEIEKRAGRGYPTLSLNEEEKYAKQIFLEKLTSHSREIIYLFAKNFVKYLLVPVESSIAKLTEIHLSQPVYFTYVRPILSLICLPIWIFALIPPVGSPKKYRMYYILELIFLFYMIGLSVITVSQGERVRFPIIAFMLPITVWNVRAAYGCLRQWVEYRPGNQAAIP
jgi:hypothetical protein